MHLSRLEVGLSELTFLNNGSPKVDWQDVTVWNHGRLCVCVLFVVVSRGFIGTSVATADLQSERKMDSVGLESFCVAACGGSWLCSYSSAETRIHPGKKKSIMLHVKITLFWRATNTGYLFVANL